MLANGGALPDDNTRRSALISILPCEVQRYITMRLDEPDYDSYKKKIDALIKMNAQAIKLDLIDL